LRKQFVNNYIDINTPIRQSAIWTPPTWWSRCATESRSCCCLQ